MHPTTVRLTLALITALALTGASACGDDPLAPRDPEDVEFDPSLGVNLAQMDRLESGVYVQTLEDGEGVGIQEDDLATLDYQLWLHDGTEIDDGRITDTAVNSNSYIVGFALGLIGAREGETRLIVIPSNLGYGAQGSARVPPHSVLVFRVSIVSITPQDD